MDQPVTDPIEEMDQPVEAPEEGEPQEPVMVRIRYNGETYEVPEHMADVWFKREEDHKRQLTELDRLRKAQQQQQPRQEQPQASPEDEDLEFFQSPSKALAKALEREREQRRQEAALERAQQAYWSAFWKEHSILVGKEPLVGSIFNQNIEYLATLTPEQSRKELAEYVLKLLQPADQGDKRKLSDKQVEATRASGPSPAPRQAQQGPPPKDSLYAQLKARKAKMQAAQFRLPKDD